MWRPRWIRPQWVKWVEDNHRWLEIQWLIADARKDPQGWGNRVSTQQGLEGWAREVLNKHPQPGDAVIWYKGYDGDFVEARVLKNTEKRVKIEYIENGQPQSRYVQSNSLKVKQSLE